MELEELLYRIFSKQIILKVDGDQFIVRSPSAGLRYKSELYRKSIYDRYKYDLPRLEQYTIFLIRNRFIEADYEKKIENMTEGIKRLKKDLFNTGSRIELEKKTRKNLNFMKDSFAKYCNTIEYFKNASLEYFCNSLKNKYILINTVYYNDKLILNENNLDLSLFNKIIISLNDADISTEKFREIARSSIWRNYWLGNKYNLFGVPAIEMSEEQKILCMFSRMYENAYENPECPDEKIIADDDKFDGWLILQQEKNKDEKKQQKYSHIDKKYQEVFRPATNQEEANKIFEENTAEGHRILKERAQTMKQHGQVRDIQFVDNRLDVLAQSSQRKLPIQK